jgi:hypothetical protein
MRRSCGERSWLIAVLHQLFDVVRHVRAEIIAARRQFPHGQGLVADVGQDQRLNIVDVLNAQAVELRLDDVEKPTVEALDQPYRF